ncbi:peptidyl-prolyl cis-trans isomerase D isoform X2 [Leptopilina boulardi]|nr:peptidyl-prolyl cis-trans isomerase D isoform X2 [Leptopilina boulardi]
MKRALEVDIDNYHSEKNPIVFLDIAIGDEYVGRIVIELFKDLAPRTVENFRSLCTGEKGIGVNGKKLCYKGSIFHKVVSHCMIQGGDIINFDGTGGESIYGPHFEDESLKTPHLEAGLVSMVNEGRPHTNSSQFVITAMSCRHLDDTNVVFGKVKKGMSAVSEINNVPTKNQIPEEKVSIINCGELKKGDNWGLEENDGFPLWPNDWDYEEKLTYKYLQEVITKIKDSGNFYFSNLKYLEANVKYKKALRYYDWMMNFKDLPDELDESFKNQKVILLLNLCAVKLKQRKFKETLLLCNKVLAIDETNSKALFRRSQAYLGLNEYQMCLLDLKQANQECPNNKNILQEIEKVKQ